MKNASKLMLLVAALAATLALAACGGDDGETIGGEFELTAEAPEAFADLSGEADLTRSEDGTTIEISLGGLEPEAEFISHLHFGGCEAPEIGGAHFKFDLDGSEEPPNEIHMMFESDADGNGEAEASAEQVVPEGDAGSVVIHLAAESTMAAEEGHDHGEGHSHSDKIACAELEGTSPKAAEAAAKSEAMNDGESSGHDHGESSEHDHGESMDDGESTRHDEAMDGESSHGEGGTAAGPTIVVAEGAPVGGVEELEFSAGETIAFTVEADAAEEIHVHGYDISKDVPAGGSASFSFPAEIEGIFEVELEALGTQIAVLRVNP